MKYLALIPFVACAIGCSGGDVGSEIPKPRPQLTAEQVESMPPQARQGMDNAQKAGDFQAQRMAEMAAAQRAAGK